MRAGSRAWLGLAGALAAGALLGWWLPRELLDWQPGLALQQPWRAWSAAWVHWSQVHLATNLLAAAAVAAFGWAAALPRAQAGAWFAAWPLTHALLALRPDLAHYGGLSGVLHAGVAIVCLWLLLQTRGARRAVGAAVSLGLLLKIVSEKPWGPALQSSADWDIALAPLAHASGAAAGLACSAVAMAWARRR